MTPLRRYLPLAFAERTKYDGKKPTPRPHFWFLLQTQRTTSSWMMLIRPLSRRARPGRLGQNLESAIIVPTLLSTNHRAKSIPHLTPLPTLCYAPAHNRTCHKGYEPEEYSPKRDAERRRSLQSRHQRRRRMGRGAGRRTMVNDQFTIDYSVACHGDATVTRAQGIVCT